MDPDYSNNSQTPINQPDPGGASPKKGWPLSRKVTIILAAVLLLIVIVAVTLASSSKKDEKTSQSGKDASLYITRPGYDGISDGIGDAVAMMSTTTDKVVKYAGADALQPCTLITIKDIQDAGLKILPNQLTGPINQTSFDGQGAGMLDASSEYSLPSPPESNFCQYYLHTKGIIELNVYQPSYANPKALDYELSRNYAALPDIEGLKTYQSTRENTRKPNEKTYFLRDGDIGAELRIDTDNQVAKDKILKLLAKRLGAAKSSPTAMQKFEFKSPVWTASALNSCELLDAAAFKSVHGTDAGPLLAESFASAIGVVETGGKKYNYVSYDCSRQSVARSSSDTYTLGMKTSTYESAEAAEQLMDVERSAQPFTKNLQEITPAIGDESFYADVAAAEKAVVFRKGRVIVRVTMYSGPAEQNFTPEKRIQALAPVLRSGIASKLAGF